MSFVRCQLCDITVNTPEQLSRHQQGKQHLKKLKTAQFLQSVGGNSSSSSINSSENRNGMNSDHSVSQLSSRIAAMSLNFTCELCEKTCNTVEQLELHKAGSQHQRNLAKQNPKSLPPKDEYEVKNVNGMTQFHCSICPNTWCSTLLELDNHRRGISHQKRVTVSIKAKPVDFDRRPGGAVRRENMSSSDLLCSKCNEPLPNESYLHSHVCKPGSAMGASASAKGTFSPPVWKSAWPELPDDLPPGSDKTRKTAGEWSSISGSLSDEASTSLPVFYNPPSLSLSSSSGSFISNRSSVGPPSSTPVFDAAVRDKIVIKEGSQEYACILCQLICNTPKAMEAHLSGGKHKKRARRMGKTVSIDDGECERPDGHEMLENQEFVRCAGDLVRCLVCDLKVNVNNLESHLAGKKHAEKKVKSGRAPSCPITRPPVVRSIKLESWTGDDALVKGLVKEEPRRYQWELFVKSMMKDTVIYLPTGTGKTLVAALAIGEMLARNPHYQAIFLVDKTLLALQQSGYLREQLADFVMPRFELSEELKTRKLRIACLCGDMHELEGENKANLWEQDVLVTTVGFYLNILQSGIVSLDHVCLVVMDEAHHCVKEHPFHRLLRNHHKALPPERRPKLLGLTASPAGAKTLEETQDQLRTLLDNLGGIEVVATEHATDELSFFTSNNKMMCVLIPMESLERDLQSHLLRFAVEILSVTLPGSTPVASLRRELESRTPNWDVIPKMLEQQSKECRSRQPRIADLVMDCIDSYFKLETGDWELASIDVEKVCLQARRFENHGSPQLSKAAKSLDASVSAIKVSTASGLQISPVMRFLTQAVEVHLRQSQDMVLVLTSQRSIARSVEDYLSSHLDEKVACLVGHGSTSGASQKSMLGDKAELTRGMSVPQQRRALAAIGEKKFRVVVATSVAEEGVDLPACGLVILLSPPTNMSSVVQMRGRARLKTSRFVVLCREETQRDKFNLLLTQESNMFSAVKELCREQAQRRIA